MRIAFISTMGGSHWGGSEVLWSKAALCLIDQGHDVCASVVGWPETPNPVKSLMKMGVKVHERKPEGVWRKRFYRWIGKVFNLKRPNKDWQNIVSFNPDLVCVSNGSSICGVEWMEFCLIAGIPCASLIQANSEHWWPDDALANRMHKVYRRMRRVYFVSEANRDLFERQIGVNLENAEVVRNPFEVSWLSEHTWPDDRVIQFACVGRLDPAAKGQDLLFRVLAMPKWKERPIMVSLFGDGPCVEGLRRLVETLGISNQVCFCGHVSGVGMIWSNHHALILPSRYEGLPLVIVEAMLSNRLVITTNVAGNKELLTDNVTGFIAVAPTVFHLDEAMERAWQQRGDWASMGLAAGEAARSSLPENPAQLFAEKLLAISESYSTT